MSQVAELATRSTERRRLPVATPLLRFARHKPLAGLGLAICVALVLAAIFAHQVAPYSYTQSIGRALESPSSTHFMGTDRLGRDVFSRILYGARVSIYVGVGAVAVGIAIAALLGMLSASGPKWVDLIVQRVVDAFMAFPALLLLLSAIAVVGPSVTTMIIVLGVLQGIGSSRIVRSAVFTVKGQDYMLAARTVGCPFVRLQLRYVLPNIMSVLIVMASVSIGGAILAEASASFLGFGVAPPTPTWGQMLSTDLQYMVIDPWLAFWPGVALTLAVFGFNVFGDGLRDVLDPRQRGR